MTSLISTTFLIITQNMHQKLRVLYSKRFIIKALQQRTFDETLQLSDFSIFPCFNEPYKNFEETLQPSDCSIFPSFILNLTTSLMSITSKI